MKNITLTLIALMLIPLGMFADQVDFPILKQTKEVTIPSCINRTLEGSPVVELKFKINKDGSIEDIKFLNGNRKLKYIMEDALKRNLVVVSPTRKNGQPIDSFVKLPFVLN